MRGQAAVIQPEPSPLYLTPVQRYSFLYRALRARGGAEAVRPLPSPAELDRFLRRMPR
jgi:hypothetical protein